MNLHKIQASLSHVAILVQSLDRTVGVVKDFGLNVNPFEAFDHEGTQECYVGASDKSARLLLLKAIKAGPYQRALEKRGPGLHHLGVWVSNLEDYADQLGAVGWLLHSKSLVTSRKQKTAYFVRPGVPYIVEAYENTATVGVASVQSVVIGLGDIDNFSEVAKRTKALGIENSDIIVDQSITGVCLKVEGRMIHLNDLVGLS